MQLLNKQKQQLRKRAKNTPSIEQQTGSGNTPLCSQYREQALKSSTSYRNIAELPLNIFIECLCDKNYTKLNVEDGEAVWQSIYLQYIDALNDRESLYAAKAELEINMLFIKTMAIESCENAITQYKNLSNSNDLQPEIIEALKALQTISGITIDSSDSEYMDKIKQVIIRAKAWIIQIENLKKQIERIINKESKHILRSDFDVLLVQLSKHMQYHVNKYQITVSEFVNILLDMKATAKAMTMKYGK